MELLSLESHTLTDGLREEIDSAARRIHTLIAKKWKTTVRYAIRQRPLRSSTIRGQLTIENWKRLFKYLSTM